ncbi:hypothetical protein, partial [Microseira wollei]|uniref:hypothetical protein n=1 Tax=Microseira wollei TaxID=467598 RepID=UPI00403A164C
MDSYINKRNKYFWVIEGDIKGAFDNIHHEILCKDSGGRRGGSRQSKTDSSTRTDQGLAATSPGKCKLREQKKFP